jgi:hypothetical protein
MGVGFGADSFPEDHEKKTVSLSQSDWVKNRYQKPSWQSGLRS